MPSGTVADDRSSAFESVDFARDDSFRAVLGLIREFHDMAEPASVPAARCKTSLASAYGLMSESSPAFTLPVSPLLSTLLLDINSDLNKFLEDQTVHGFLPVPGRSHRRYYGTSTSSFPGPYTVPRGVTSITLEKASEVKKRSFFVHLTGLLDGDHAFGYVRGLILVGLVAVDLRGFQGSSACRSSC